MEKLELKLKIMYIYTAILTMTFGLGIVVLPNIMVSLFGWPEQDPIVFGVMGSVYVAFALLALLGLRDPVKFIPILLLQLFYKVVWFIGVVIPLLVTGSFPLYGLLYVIIFATFIVGDLLTIPFSEFFRKDAK
jgi:hypothetical protein